MGIEAVLRTETEDVASVSDSRMVLSRAVSSGQLADTRLLKYLLPWGDAIFNQAQANDLLDDIRIAAGANVGSPLGKHLLEIKPLVEQLAAETHCYLWFIGD